MIDLQYIRNFYPASIADNPAFHKHMVKEYVELMALDFLSSTPYINKMAFIGGTNLRLVKSIDRFSEDLDFDCKDLTREEFVDMTDAIIANFKKNGLQIETRDKPNDHLNAFRRNLFFPQLLFDLGLTGHREQRFLLKVEAQDQGIDYNPIMAQIARYGFVFQIPVPPDSILLSMKLSALLSRAKGRDFYDTMFLWQIIDPDYDFLFLRCGIKNKEELVETLNTKLEDIDLELKSRDFQHLLFNPENARRILQFKDFLTRI